MFSLKIPGLGQIRLEHLVTDFTGTLSVDGKLLPAVKETLNGIADAVKIHVLTADTFAMARAELADVECDIHILDGERHDLQKEAFVERIGAEHVMALGNGNNDRLMLKAAKIGIAVCLPEGCARDAVDAANILVTSPLDALQLLAAPNRLKATLRF